MSSYVQSVYSSNKLYRTQCTVVVKAFGMIEICEACYTSHSLIIRASVGHSSRCTPVKSLWGVEMLSVLCICVWRVMCTCKGCVYLCRLIWPPTLCLLWKITRSKLLMGQPIITVLVHNFQMVRLIKIPSLSSYTMGYPVITLDLSSCTTVCLIKILGQNNCTIAFNWWRYYRERMLLSNRN